MTNAVEIKITDEQSKMTKSILFSKEAAADCKFNPIKIILDNEIGPGELTKIDTILTQHGSRSTYISENSTATSSIVVSRDSSDYVDSVSVIMKRPVSTIITNQNISYRARFISSTTSTDQVSVWATYDSYYKAYINANFPSYTKPLSAQIKDIIESRQSPQIIVKSSTRQVIQKTRDQREIRARETLRLLIGDDKYNRYLNNGFISVQGKSGLIYQVFPGHKMTNVFNQGQMLERLCIVLDYSYAPTDSVLMRYLLILNDESELKQLSNKHSPIITIPHKVIETGSHKSLVDLYREMKAAA